MTVAFDKFTAVIDSALANPSGTHTPVGTPRAVLVFIVEVAGTATCTAVTYGGVAMTQLAGSPNNHTTGELGSVTAWFLGASIPTGAQTVATTAPGNAVRAGFSYTLTAAADTEVVDVDATINSDSVASPSVTLSLTGRTCFAVIGGLSGQNAPGSISPSASWNSRGEIDEGTVMAFSYSYDTIAATDVTAGWSQAADDAVAIAVAVSEVAATVAAEFAAQGRGVARGVLRGGR